MIIPTTIAEKHSILVFVPLKPFLLSGAIFPMHRGFEIEKHITVCVKNRTKNCDREEVEKRVAMRKKKLENEVEGDSNLLTS